MAFVQFNKVSLAFGDRDILKNVSVNLAAGSKAALTGANGTGKSTLIKVMAGLVSPDDGLSCGFQRCKNRLSSTERSYSSRMHSPRRS